MINGKFKLLSSRDKQEKFRAVLKVKTKESLTENEINSVLRMISPKRQYSIFVYTDVVEFSRILAVKKPCIGRIVFGQVLVGTADLPGRLFCTDRAAAVMIRKAGDEDLRRLHIYIPLEIYRKDNTRSNEQGLEKAHRS